MSDETPVNGLPPTPAEDHSARNALETERASDSAADKATESAPRERLEASLEDLTVAQLIGLLLRQSPSAMRRPRLGQARRDPPTSAEPVTAPSPEPLTAGKRLDLLPRLTTLSQARYAQLALYLAAFFCAYVGSVYARGGDGIPRGDEFSLYVGAPWLWAGFLLWLLGELAGNWRSLRAGWRSLDKLDRQRWLARVIPALVWVNGAFMLATSFGAPADQSPGMALNALVRLAAGGIIWIAINAGFRWLRHRSRAPDDSAFADRNEVLAQIMEREPLRRPPWREISRLRAIMFLVACACGWHVWQNSTGNYISLDTMKVWFGASLLWCFVFAPLRWNAFDQASSWIDHARRIGWNKHRGVIAAFLLLMILGASFRYDMLGEVPRYLYSDLVEDLQDAYKIYEQDDYRIFLSNITGREPLHHYMLSILSSQDGMNFDHFALKHGSALWTLLAMPLMFWMAVEVFYGLKRDRSWGLIVGLAMLGLVAGSFWHVVIGRQGMRINTATFWVSFAMIFFVRALRGNRRCWYALAGLALGYGLLSYMAVRMAPLAIVFGVCGALLLRKHSWRTRISYLLNLATLAVVAFAVFMPMMRFWTEYPDDFARRATTRTFGDAPSSPDERAEFLLTSGARFLTNWRNQMLMYHYRSDHTWVNNAPGAPAMDPVSAGLMILGAAAWLSLMARSRDPFVWFVPVLLFFTMLSSALALSFPAEVPSLSRSSAAIAPSYLIAALPLAIVCRQIYRCLPRLPGLLLGLGFGALTILASNEFNTNHYFGRFADNFNNSSHPYVEAGAALRGFVDSGGSYGNAMVVAYAHWMDIRAIGVDGGAMLWDNGIGIDRIPWLIRENFQGPGKWGFDPDRDLLFFYASHDQEAPTRLSEWFPQGWSQKIEAHKRDSDFFVYRVPAPGESALRSFVDRYAS